MKKRLFTTLLGLSLILSGCMNTSSEDSSTPPASSEVPTTSVTPSTGGDASSVSETPTHQDITIVVTVKGLTLNEGNALFFGSSLGGTSAAWASTKMTKGEGETWSTTFNEIAEGYYGFNVYIGLASATESWAYINSEGDGATPRQLGVILGTATYNLDATFTAQPDATNTADLTLNITSNIELTTSNHMWVWTSITGGNVLLTGSGKNWTYAFSDVVVGTVKFTAVIGSASEPNWAYKASNVDGTDFTFTKESPVINIDATFSNQPAEPTETSVSVHFVLTAVLSSDFHWPKVVVGESWNDMEQGEGDNEWIATLLNIEIGETISFYFYAWDDVNKTEHQVYNGTVNTLFTVDVDEEMTISVTGDFSTGIGSLNE